MPGIFDDARFRMLLLSYPAKAIELLYQHYSASLLLLAKSLTRDDIASEDIVQETFSYVWENRKRLSSEHQRSIEHYLVRAVKFKSITHYQRERKLNQKKIDYFNGRPVDSSQGSIEESIIRAEVIEEIRQVINTFPRREKECLLMKIQQNMSPAEIAEKLKVTVKAVERSLTSANKRLKKHWLEKK